MKPLKEEVNWDKKKIIVFSTVVIFVILFLSYRLAGFNSDEPLQKPKTQIEGIGAQDVSKNIQETVENLQEQAESLNIEEVASSSPQIQKVINDLKFLKDVPKNELKNTCERICNGL
ncbi:MAG: hypothetical protein A3B38_03260 [Candidatus Levybacteria bacterium RIFCSPLOWO2_01_FULL_36_13]|nr:MAG: hypothetical protein A2684_04205 [Candidatus Levybacteria bacterium RIFCSPHIGHO2_01_FULL_36_15b]OGH34699.1 MAG: hypothetical protein A3B38_03260 [Candidatus Levybacteria bacterium RIFCSPLOWO2_01_FULL_36_13]